MIKNTKIKEKESVLNIINKYIDNKKDIPYKVIKEEIKKIKDMEEDYIKTVNDLLWHNSLLIKIEKLFDLINIISANCIEDEEKLDKVLLLLNDCVKTIKD